MFERSLYKEISGYNTRYKHIYIFVTLQRQLQWNKTRRQSQIAYVYFRLVTTHMLIERTTKLEL